MGNFAHKLFPCPNLSPSVQLPGPASTCPDLSGISICVARSSAGSRSLVLSRVTFAGSCQAALQVKGQTAQLNWIWDPNTVVKLEISEL